MNISFLGHVKLQARLIEIDRKGDGQTLPIGISFSFFLKTIIRGKISASKDLYNQTCMFVSLIAHK